LFRRPRKGSARRESPPWWTVGSELPSRAAAKDGAAAGRRSHAQAAARRAGLQAARSASVRRFLAEDPVPTLPPGGLPMAGALGTVATLAKETVTRWTED